MNKIKQYEYIKVGNNVVCRYPFDKNTKKLLPIGDVYNFKEKKWITTTNTMKFKMSGEYDTITSDQVLKIIKTH